MHINDNYRVSWPPPAIDRTLKDGSIQTVAHGRKNCPNISNGRCIRWRFSAGNRISVQPSIWKILKAYGIEIDTFGEMSKTDAFPETGVGSREKRGQLAGKRA